MKHFSFFENHTPPTTNQKLQNWGPRAAVVVTLGIYFGAQLVTAIGLGLVARARGYDSAGIEKLLDTSVIWQFWFFALFEILSIGLLRWFMRRRHIKWSDLGLKRPRITHILRALPVFISYFAALIIATLLLDHLVDSIDTNQKQQLGFDQAAQGFLPLLLIFVALVILTPVVEEILVRGFLYGGLRNRLPVLKAALITSGIFGLAHLQLGSNGPPLWIAAVDTFILSMFLVWLREKTGNLWAGIVVHMIKNGLAFASLYIFHVS